MKYIYTTAAVIFLFFLHIPFNSIFAQGQLVADGNVHEIKYQGKNYLDLKIPADLDLLQYNQLTFVLKGADGGRRKIPFICTEAGGEGAKVTATFELGESGDVLIPGSTVRFIVGGQGESVRSGEADGAGGGGGTGLLYKSPDVEGNGTCEDFVVDGGGLQALPTASPNWSNRNSCWVILAVAGAGGGAYAPGGCAQAGTGKGGEQGESGSDGKGLSGGSGGTGGSAGQNAWGGGGGGYKLKYWDKDSKHGQGGGLFGGNGASAQTFDVSAGGWGYGGGGSGKQTAGTGGGGGGFSGGGGGDLYEAGGGGGSFVNSAAYSSHKKGGGSDKTPNNGWITYEFSNNADLVDAPVARCKDIVVGVEGSDFAHVTPDLADDGSYDPEGRALTFGLYTTCDVDEDNCTVYYGDDFGYGCGLVGETVTLQLAVSNGLKESTCQFLVEIEEGNPVPVICPENIVVNADPATCSRVLNEDLLVEDLGTCNGILENSIVTPSGNTDNINTFKGNVISGEFEMGVTTIYYTVKRESDDQSTSCSFTVRINDGSSPELNCPANITMDLPSGECSRTISQGLEAEWIDNCSTVLSHTIVIEEDDDDGGDGLSTDPPSLPGLLSSYEFESGTTRVTYLLQDDNGFHDQCSFTVSLVDNEAPTARCFPDIIYQLDDPPANLIDEIDNGSYDNCNIVSRTLNRSFDFDCNNVGARRSVTLTVKDAQGNEDECYANILVRDQVGPIAKCHQGLGLSLRDNGTAVLPISLIDNGSYDACGIASRSLSKTSFTCADIGPQTVTLFLIDNNGNTSQCDAQISVNDGISPKAICRDISVSVNAEGEAVIGTSDINNDSYDNCGIRSMSLDKNTFDCNDIGTENTVTLTVTDHNGTTGSCIAKVTVEDNVAPNALCQDVSIQLDANGEGSISAAAVNKASYDACGIAGLSLNKDHFTSADLGDNTVTLTVTDVHGNVNSCNATVRVEDNVGPEALCRNVVVQLDEDGSGSTTAEEVDNGSNDAGGIASLVLDRSSFSCNDVGDHTVTLTATDNNGNSSTCTATVTVEDKLPPVITCQDITVQLKADGSFRIPSANFIRTNVITSQSDNCAFGTVVRIFGGASFSCADVGTPLTRSIIVFDVNGNPSNKCFFNITAQDVTPPEARCKDITLALDENGLVDFIPSMLDDGSSDNCELALQKYTIRSLSCADIGSFTSTFTVKDLAGNTSSCSAMVTVVDNRPPIPHNASLPTFNMECSVSLATPIAIDNCAGIIQGTTDDPTSFTEQGTYTVNWMYDDGNGNVATQTQTVIVSDVSKPMPYEASLPAIIGECSASVSSFPLAFDNCEGLIILGYTTDPLYYSEQGTYTITWTYDDGNGNTSTQLQTVIVDDVTAPLPDMASLPTITGECSASVLEAPTATDNCEGIITGTTNDPLTYTEQGTHTITWTFDDSNGNIETQTQTVIVDDVTAPVPDQYAGLPVYLPSIEGECEVSVDVAPTATDNCAGTITGTTTDPLYYDEPGTYWIRWTYDDGNGNLAGQLQKVSVQDHTAPIALCKNTTIQIDENGQATLLPTMIDNGSFDECSPISMQVGLLSGDFGPEGLPLAEIPFNCSVLGEKEVYLLITDAAGMQSRCEALVSIEANGNCEEEGTSNPGETPTPPSPGPSPFPGRFGWNLQQSAESLAQDQTKLQAFPTPFQANLTIRFSLSQTAKTSIEIINQHGRRVRSLLSAEMEAGEHQLEWNGTDLSGMQLPSGLYLLQLRTGKEVINKKILLQR